MKMTYCFTADGKLGCFTGEESLLTWAVDRFHDVIYFEADIVPMEEGDFLTDAELFFVDEDGDPYLVKSTYLKSTYRDPGTLAEIFDFTNYFLAKLSTDEKSDLKMREGDQPLPIHTDGTPIQTLVVEDILDRMEVGIKRYGTPLQANNGRDALRDAYEEALDLAIYLRQVIEERNGSTK